MKASHFQNDRRWYTVAQQLVKLCPYVHDSLWRLFLNDHVGDLIAVCFPIWFGDRR